MPQPAWAPASHVLPLLQAPESTPMDERQRYLFDTRGFIVIPGVIEQCTLRELNRLFSLQQGEPEPGDEHSPPFPTGDALHWGQPYVDLLDHLQVAPILEELFGRRPGEVEGADAALRPLPNFRIDHINTHNWCNPRYIRQHGHPGITLHGGWKNTGGSQFFREHQGHFYNGLLVATYELMDTDVNGGGCEGCFTLSVTCCLPAATATGCCCRCSLLASRSTHLLASGAQSAACQVLISPIFPCRRTCAT
eukprot:COSAG01_NODE_2477_length_7615_cov_7.259609_9_plen_250_part_00